MAFGQPLGCERPRSEPRFDHCEAGSCGGSLRLESRQMVEWEHSSSRVGRERIDYAIEVLSEGPVRVQTGSGDVSVGAFGHFDEFVTLGYDATAEAGSMFGDEKAEIGVRFVDGRAIFVLTKQGWKVSATAAGTTSARTTSPSARRRRGRRSTGRRLSSNSGGSSNWVAVGFRVPTATSWSVWRVPRQDAEIHQSARQSTSLSRTSG